MGGGPDRVTHSFIIRHPAKAVTSLWSKSCIDTSGTGYTYFDPVEAGFIQMAQMYDHLLALGAPPPAIIDADDILEDPEGVLSAYSDRVGMPFDAAMLSWELGPVPELQSSWSGWTEDVQTSGRVRRRESRSEIPLLHDLPELVIQTIAEAMPIYERLYALRVRSAVPIATAPQKKPKVAEGVEPIDEDLSSSSSSHLSTADTCAPGAGDAHKVEDPQSDSGLTESSTDDHTPKQAPWDGMAQLTKRDSMLSLEGCV
jgi:hypothetical protein